MKIFFYKVLTFFVLFFIFYKLTIGQTIKLVEMKIDNLKSKENAEIIKMKVRDEISNALKKDRYLNKEDAILINNFIDKIRKELEVNYTSN